MNRLRTFLSAGLTVAVGVVSAQTVTRTLELQARAETVGRQQELSRDRAHAAADLFQLETRRVEFGRTKELVAWENRPVYLQTLSNVDAAVSTRANTLWPGGSTGLNLTGAGLVLGIWDGGTPLANHQEFIGRVTNMDDEGPGDHATHVAGTMVASGVNPIARGMAYEANLQGYGWNRDASEMAAAAANGLRISNHSYGFIAGWTRSGSTWQWYGNPSLNARQDARFGSYSSTARLWDDIAYNAPFYLIVKAAGNDRGEGPAAGTAHMVWSNSGWVSSTATRDRDGGSGGFDCLSSDATGKNTLIVGAVNDVLTLNRTGTAVTMSSFSSWGPTDDGRIKPDLVANGVSLTSPISSSPTAYGGMSGTSMASPNASGTLALVGQHFQNTRDQWPRSATLKGIAIHTADEAGPGAGPDYRFGWGLLNAQRAAELITQAQSGAAILQERTIQSGVTDTINVTGVLNRPLRVTIVWTDPAGTVPAFTFNNRTPVLVNDLDLRVRQSTTTFLPWVLSPSNPGANATRADNRVDNVEQVVVDRPVNGTYTITVRGKTTLRPSGSQAYTLIVSGQAQAQ